MQATDRGWTGWLRVIDTLDTRNVSTFFISDGLGFSDQLRFLLRSQRWPFVSSSVSHHDIAFACVSQLTQTLEFASNEMPSNTLMETVGLGLLGLQGYALEYWISHVFHFLEATAEPLDLRGPLMTQLLQFATKHANMAKTLSKCPSTPSESTSNLSLERIPSKLKAAPELHTFICQVLDFRHEFDAKQASEGPGKLEKSDRPRGCANSNDLCTDILAPAWDPTVLSRADWKYNDAVKSLLLVANCDGLSSAELQAFQSEYRRTAFTCTVRSCERSRLGYPSSVELEDHKIRQHTAGFKCYHQNCPYNDIGFTTLRSLRVHQKKSHLRDLPEIPRTLKRKYSAENSPKDTGAIEVPGSVPQSPRRQNVFNSAYSASPFRPLPRPYDRTLPPRQPDPPKKSNLLSLLNDDPSPAPPSPKRVDEISLPFDTPKASSIPDTDSDLEKDTETGNPSPPRQPDPPKNTNLNWLLNDDSATAPPAPKTVDEAARGGNRSSDPISSHPDPGGDFSMGWNTEWKDIDIGTIAPHHLAYPTIWHS